MAKKRKYMRRSNGSGSITMLSGNRRNPYIARVPFGFYENGNPIQKYLGSFPSRIKAEEAIHNYLKDPSQFIFEETTFEELFLSFWEDRFGFVYGKKETKLTQVEYSYSTAYKNSACFHDRVYSTLKKNDYEKVISDLVTKGLGASSVSNLKKLWNGMNEFSKVSDLKEEGFKAVKIPEFEKRNKHKVLLKEDIKIVLKHSAEVEHFDSVIVLLYTGMRISELLNVSKENVYVEKRYMVGGMKTGAGRNRIIPLHNAILPIIERQMKTKGKKLFPKKDGTAMSYHWYRKNVWDVAFQNELKMGYLPHDTRHTFTSRAERCNIKTLLIQRIVGHTGNNITHDVYTHTEAEELVEAIDIFFYE